MRVLSILASPAPGGAENLVRNLSAEFTRRGHQSHIVFLSNAGGVGNPTDYERDFLARLEQEGTSYDILEPRSFRNPFRAGSGLRGVARSFRPDLVHAHLARGLLAMAAGNLRYPTVYTHHNMKANLPTLLFSLLIRRVHRCIAIGTICRKFIEKHYRGPVDSIPNGVPVTFARAGERKHLATDPFLLSVGTLSPQKDYPTLIEAAAKVVPRFAAAGRNVRFAIAGEGAERGNLERLIGERGLGANFAMLGARSDVANLMKEADLLVNSSVFEGLPIALIEAVSSGLPAVVTDVGDNSEVVKDGVNGLVVPPGDSNALAAAIYSILTDERQYIAFSQSALSRAKRFTINDCATAHLSLYETVLATGKRPAGKRQAVSGARTPL